MTSSIQQLEEDVKVGPSQADQLKRAEHRLIALASVSTYITEMMLFQPTDVLYKNEKWHKAVALVDNIRHAYRGEKSQDEIDEAVNKAYDNIVLWYEGKFYG